MNYSFREIPGSVTAPNGFLASGVFCDIKRLGTGKGSNKGRKRDLGLILSEVPARAAGLFTTNQVMAAPVKLCLPRAERGVGRAIVANSGNANACTGERGMRDAGEMASLAASALGVDANDVFVCSTGRIGVPMPMQNVANGIRAAADVLQSRRKSAREFAEAIMTSDTRRKEIAVEFECGGATVRIGGVCKGAGMIQPGMSFTGKRPAATPLHATMLCFLTTDAEIDGPALKQSLGEAVAQSFNRVTVDGDMSTNDSAIVLANGAAGNKMIRGTRGAAAAAFQEALNFVTLELAKKIARDGEGVSRFVTVKVEGAKSFADADAAARAVANSALVKTSWCGGDPNWGRVLDALGYSAAEVTESLVDMGYAKPGGAKTLPALLKGQPAATPLAELRKIVRAPEFELRINLNLGRHAAVIYTADLTEEYVDFNKGE
jgi:glutamate N-acetyltransferase/amino-acid N-acetyltransferase